MVERNSREGIQRHVYAHWPGYLLIFGGGGLLAMLIALMSARQGWWSFVLLALALLLFLAFFLVAQLWAAHQQYDTAQLYDKLQSIGELGPEDRFIHIDLGRRLPANELASRLTRGQVIVVDIYNPQLTPSASLRRWRTRAVELPADPRLRWLDGSLDLLPFPDKSQDSVILIYTAYYLWQHGDRQRVFEEIKRILRPGGQLLMAERTRSNTNVLVMGPLAGRLPSDSYWRSMLLDSGFHIQQESSLHGVVHIYRALKPQSPTSQQLLLNL